MSCELCKLENRAHLYYEDDDFIIVDCETCHIPMIVTKEHTMYPSISLVEKMKHKAYELFGHEIRFRTKQQKILNHWHWHILVE